MVKYNLYKNTLKILIIGSSGILGYSLYKELNKTYKVYHTGLRKRLYDLTYRKNLIKVLNKKIDIVINCSAITNIEYAEKNKKVANDINYKLVKNILLLNEVKKFYFINFSTDQVYNSNKISNNKEENISFRGNYYTKSKIKADKLINKYKFLALRVNFFGKSYRGKGTFTDWLILQLKNKKKIFLFEDQFFSPLSIDSLIKIVKKILKKRIFGIYNVGSKGNISKKDLAIAFYKYLKKKNINFESVKVNNFLDIKRSNFMSMNCTKFEKKFQIKLSHISKEIKKVSNQYR
jgi:dTDP-4-dehydrorhamnose reductase